MPLLDCCQRVYSLGQLSCEGFSTVGSKLMGLGSCGYARDVSVLLSVDVYSIMHTPVCVYIYIYIKFELWCGSEILLYTILS